MTNRTEALESERAELVALNEWMREPDYAESFSLAEITDWINRRPIATAARLAAQDQKPVAFLHETEWGDKSLSFEPAKNHLQWKDTPLYLSPPPTAGWDELLTKIEYASRKDSLTDRERIQSIRTLVCAELSRVEALRHNAPPDSGAVKSEQPIDVTDFSPENICRALSVSESVPAWIRTLASSAKLPDHGGADAGARISNLAADLIVSGWMASNPQNLELRKKEAEQKLLDFACDEIERHMKRQAALSKPAPVAADLAIADFNEHPSAPWPDPTPAMLDGDALFDAIWQTIKSWDVNVPAVYSGYCGASGNHVRAIYDAVKSAPVDANASVTVEKLAHKLTQLFGDINLTPFDQARELIASGFVPVAANASAEPAFPTWDAEDEAYALGKLDGYEDAIQDIDIATGGDGEFKGSTIPGETVDTETMKQRIVGRCANASAEARLRDLRETYCNVIEDLQSLCSEFGCQGGQHRIDWLRSKLKRLNELEALSTHPHASDKQGEAEFLKLGLVATAEEIAASKTMIGPGPHASDCDKESAAQYRKAVDDANRMNDKGEVPASDCDKQGER